MEIFLVKKNLFMKVKMAECFSRMEEKAERKVTCTV